MNIIKDSNYWKEYNQKRKEYLLEKKRQSRAKLKSLVVDIPGLVVDQTKEIKVVDKDIESYNQEVYRRAGTKEEARFFTFADGRKIVRTKCGCNPTKDFYDWCLDSCEYFTYWRNKRYSE